MAPEQQPRRHHAQDEESESDDEWVLNKGLDLGDEIDHLNCLPKATSPSRSGPSCRAETTPRKRCASDVRPSSPSLAPSLHEWVRALMKKVSGPLVFGRSARLPL